MIRGERNKKGLSPLIATVLLIAFAVSLGTMIMSWSIEPAQQETQAGTCQDVQIAVQEITTGPAICYDERQQTVNFLLQNNGQTPIPVLVLRVIDNEQNVQEQEIEANLNPGDLGQFQVPSPLDNPRNLVATVQPRILDGAFTQACTNKQLEEIELEMC